MLGSACIPRETCITPPWRHPTEPRQHPDIPNRSPPPRALLAFEYPLRRVLYHNSRGHHNKKPRGSALTPCKALCHFHVLMEEARHPKHEKEFGVTRDEAGKMGRGGAVAGKAEDSVRDVASGFGEPFAEKLMPEFPGGKDIWISGDSRELSNTDWSGRRS